MDKIPSTSDVHHLLHDFVFANTAIITGSILFFFAVFFSYKKYKESLLKKENNECTIKQSETGIPKPSKKQDIVTNKRPESKKDEKQWKTPIGLQNKSKSSNTDPSKSKKTLQEKKDASPSKSPKTYYKEEMMPEIVNKAKIQETHHTDIKTKILLREENPPETSFGPVAKKSNQNVPVRLTEVTKNPDEKSRPSSEAKGEARSINMNVQEKKNVSPKTHMRKENFPDTALDPIGKTLSQNEQERIKEDKKITEEKSNPRSEANTEARRLLGIPKRQLIVRPERDEIKEAEDFQKELKETERKAEEEARRFMKPINLNIDKNARTKEESKKIKEKELNLVRMMCGEFREVTKLDGNEEKEEKRKEMEKVRSARTYFKDADKYRSESMSAVPRMKLRMEEENLKKSSQMRLSQFEPGKIQGKFTSMFDGANHTETEAKQTPPRKKLITLDQVLKKSMVEDEQEQALLDRDRELEELKQARKNWTAPEDNKAEDVGTDPPFKSNNNSAVKKRWAPVNSERKEKTKSLNVPQKLDIKDIFCKEPTSNIEGPKKEVEKELNEIRESRPTPLTKRWKPKPYQKPAERSQSAHVPHRATLSDNSWVLEKSESRMEEERKKALDELEFVKKVRMETLEVVENNEIERPSSRFETMKELEELKKSRSETFVGNRNWEKQEETKGEIRTSHLKSPDIKCVRFNESNKEEEIPVEKDTEEVSTKGDSRVKTKLQQIKQQTEKGMSKLTSSKFKQLQDLESKNEKTREELPEKTKDMLISRSRSLSRIRNAGQKMMELTNEQLSKLTKPKMSKAARA